MSRKKWMPHEIGLRQAEFADRRSRRQSIDLADFDLLAEDFSNPATLTSQQLATMQAFAGQFGDTLVPNSNGVGFTVVSVPEPIGLALAIAPIALLARRRRHQGC
jgi:hypothetical protein